MGADGIVFVVQTVSDTAGGAGYGIGYVGLSSRRRRGARHLQQRAQDDNREPRRHRPRRQRGLRHAGRRDAPLNDARSGTLGGPRRLADLLEVRLPHAGPPATPHALGDRGPRCRARPRRLVGFTSGTGAAAAGTTSCPSLPQHGGSGRLRRDRHLDRHGDGHGLLRRVRSCSRVMTVVDTAPPALALLGGGGCEAGISAEPTTSRALVRVQVLADDACDRPGRDERPPGGRRRRLRVYACGVTTVTSSDGPPAGSATACFRCPVRVQPSAPPPSVGAALRVRKDAAGAAVLDWSLAGPRARVGAPHGPPAAPSRASACCPPSRAGGRPAVDGRGTGEELVLYDVRAVDCLGGLSRD